MILENHFRIPALRPIKNQLTNARSAFFNTLLAQRRAVHGPNAPGPDRRWDPRIARAMGSCTPRPAQETPMGGTYPAEENPYTSDIYKNRPTP